VPRTTFSLEARADYYRFSTPLVRLSTGQSFELTLKPLQINESPDQQFGHSVEVWLLTDDATPETFSEKGIALSLIWLGDSDWRVSSYTPESRWRATNHRVQIRLGDQRSVRLVRRPDGAVEFFLEGASVLTLPASEAARVVRARVVGASAEFSYMPSASTSGASFADSRGSALQTCGQCDANDP
jgi:hypothetical protein